MLSQRRGFVDAVCKELEIRLPELGGEDINTIYFGGGTPTLLEKGELELNMNHKGLDDLKNQLSISIIVAALLVGSSITIWADKGPKVGDISAINGRN